MEIEHQPVIEVLNRANLGILSSNWLERWYDFGRINWATELEYPEFTMKQTQEILKLRLN